MGKVLIIIGAVLTLVSFLFLPWLEFVLLSPFVNIVQILKLLGPEVELVINLLTTVTFMDGKTIAFVQPLASVSFRLVMALPPLFAVLALLGVVAQSFGFGDTRGLMVQAGASALVLVMLLANIHALARLGTAEKLIVPVIDVFQPELAIGFWLTLVGVVLIGIGSVVQSVSIPSVQRTPQRRYR